MPVIYGIHPHKASSEQKHPLGSLGLMNDGRAYRYAKAGGLDLSPGKLCISTDLVTNHEDLAVNTFKVGDRNIDVTVGGTAISAYDYDEGFVNITDGTGEGIMYKIKHCPATSGSEAVTIELTEPIRVTAVDATTVTLYKNKYRDVIVSASSKVDIPVGVPNVTIATTYYGWLQTKGPCSVLNDETTTVAVGQPVTIGAVTVGAVEVIAAVTEPIVGMVPAGALGDTEEYVVIELTLD